MGQEKTPKQIVKVELKLHESKTLKEGLMLAKKLAKLYRKTVVCPRCGGIGLLEAKTRRGRGKQD